MNKIFKLLAGMFLISVLGSACAPTVITGTGEHGVDETLARDVVGAFKLKSAAELNWLGVSQGWNEEQRLAFWFTPQGSMLMPYEWFLHLPIEGKRTVVDTSGKVPDCSAEWKFCHPTNMAKFGYLPGPKDSTWNPNGLPLGFTKSPTDAGGYVGPTCAACHTNLMEIQKAGKTHRLFIEGAPTLSDLQAFNRAVVDAMIYLDGETERFDAFARAVLGASYSDAKRDSLRGEFGIHLISLAARNEWNYKHLTPAQNYGRGRLDAIGAILNQVSVTAADDEINTKAADAPVSFPFLWGTPQSDVVQWNGLAPNQAFGFGPLIRNMGEVIGVFGDVTVALTNETEKKYVDKKLRGVLGRVAEKKPLVLGYRSSIIPSNLGTLEHWLSKLRSPKWPEKLIGKYNSEMVKEGRKIYMGETEKTTGTKCVGCHQYVSRDEEGEPYRAFMIRVPEIGTDPKMANNFLLETNPRTGKRWESGRFEGTRAGILLGKKYGKHLNTRGEALITMGVGAVLGKLSNSLKGAYLSRSNSSAGEKQDFFRYKARPLTGIWATAPYLHNGSVPNLMALLSPPTCKANATTQTNKCPARPTRFYTGSRKFDPVNVGFEYDNPARGDLLDTSVPGNSNEGHWGPRQGSRLTSLQKRQLIEFMKTL